MPVTTFVKVNDFQPKFTGILQAVSPTITSMCSSALIPPGQIRLSKFHLTLIHQSLLKPVKAEVKSLIKDGGLPTLPKDIKVYTEPRLREGFWRHPEAANLDQFRSGFALLIEEDSASELKMWCDTVLTILGVEEREPREFHVSISNLTGKSGDSLR